LCFPSFTSFSFNDTATTEIYTLSLHDALPIYSRVSRSTYQIRTCESISRVEPKRLFRRRAPAATPRSRPEVRPRKLTTRSASPRSEEHTSELQSRSDLVCRLLLEKKKTKQHNT